MKKRKNTSGEKEFVTKPQKDFLDMIAPSVVKFYTDYFICGNTFRCVWALREYPTSTSEQAILCYLGEKDGVTLRIYTRHVTAAEEKRIIANAANKNRMQRSSTNNLQQTVAAESNLQDVAQLAADMHRNREPLLHVAVFIEMISDSLDNLRILQTEVQTELVRSKLNVDKLMLRQQHGFMSVMPGGRNMFREQFESFIDLMSGEYIINVLEPKTWDDGSNTDEDAPQAFKCKTKLSQHISFLRDFFRTYKDFTDREIDTIELLLIKLYDNFGISDDTDWSALKPADYPILSDFYALLETEYQGYNPKQKNLYTSETLQNICLGLHSLCKGAESKFFDGHTNITDDNFVTFGVKGLLQASKNIRNALLFNILSYMSEQLLTKGNTVASVDEFYLFLSNLTAVEYIRNFMKRVRKKESAVILASQNIEDFLTENVRELTKPLFAIPTHQFLFNAGTVDSTFYMDALQLEPSEYKIIRYPHRGMCLYKCGNERYCLCVTAPPYKAELFGKAGGR